MLELVRVRLEYVAAGMFLAAWLFILGLRALPLGGAWGPLDPITNWFILLWVSFAAVAMIAGGWLARRSLDRITPSRMDPDLPVMLLSLASMIGAVLIIIEFAVVRGYGFSMPVTQIRILEVNRGMEGATASLLSGPGRLMMPAILPALLIVALEWRRLSKISWLLFCLAAVAFLYEQIKFEGGRWFLFGTYFSMAFLLFGDLFRRTDEGQPSLGRRLVAIVVFLGLYGAILLGYSISVFENRYADKGESQSAAYQRFSKELIEERSATEAPYQENSTELIDERSATGAPHPKKIDNAQTSWKPSEDFTNSAVGKLLFHPTTKFFWIYATHGVNELNNLVNWGSFSHSLGAYQFPQIARIAGKFLGTGERVEYKKNFPNAGLYTTMIGASFVDFGIVGAIAFGAVFSFMLGFWANLFGRQAGISFSALAFPTMMTVAALSPIISIVNHMWPVLCWAGVAYLIATYRFAERRRLGNSSSQV